MGSGSLLDSFHYPPPLLSQQHPVPRKIGDMPLQILKLEAEQAQLAMEWRLIKRKVLA
ncbi:hypothetical protein DPMN_114909 [Dreissena polymorpha]|uniref:Uncharacterized protein n=1 Tax=Dreissena polymorpha TaxID=45954 RepID=A0A9D4KKS1_DREPO|nr:hypothetical protein DPMN_114909 [Dreissena polymorpha]